MNDTLLDLRDRKVAYILLKILKGEWQKKLMNLMLDFQEITELKLQFKQENACKQEYLNIWLQEMKQWFIDLCF